MNRDFKGVWIPKEVWINKDLTWMEKLFLVEIDSLDNEEHCFASNAYFSDFFNLKITRVSQIINSLKKKDFIDIKMIREGQQIVKRVITIKRKNLFKKVYEPLKNTVRTPLEKCKDNNTYNNTININAKLNNEIHYTNKFFSITKEKHTLYSETYNKVNIDYEYKNMYLWLINNPTRRKTNYGKFIQNWLRKANDNQPDDKGLEMYPEVK